MKEGKQTKFQCVVCGKITAGRIPKRGDGSLRYPRRHKNIKGDEPCKGNIIEANWITI